MYGKFDDGGVASGITTLPTRTRTFAKNIWNLASEIKTAKNTQGNATSTTQTTVITSDDSKQQQFESVIRSYIDDVFASQQTDITLASFSEVKDVTPAFDMLGKIIGDIKLNVL